LAKSADDAMTTTPLLRLQGIVKQYPGTLANDHVDLTIAPGEIHALLGENGAGKSTLVKIIYGVVKPNAGDIFWDGEKVEIPSPNAARATGIGMVFQHFSLFEGLTVAENLALGMNEQRSRKQLRDDIAMISERYGLQLDPSHNLADLSLGERQRIEIVRCLMQSPRLLIMDEPTSVLTPQEVDKLFETLRKLADQGCSVLYISHKLNEIRALCQKATVMRHGKVVAHCDPREETTTRLAEMMIGEMLTKPRPRLGHAADAAACLVVDRLTIASDRKFGVDLKAVTFSVAKGQILGIAGVAGNGQTELMDALSGETPSGKPEAVTIDGVVAGHRAPAERRALGACFVPEERNGHAAVPGMTLSDNALLSGYVRKALARLGFIINRPKTTSFAAQVIKRFDVRTTGPMSEARSLSGGNLQKFVVGREVLQDPKLLVVSQPTWGVDAGAAAAIHDALVLLAEAGTAIVVISQDLDEIFSLCDSIAVIAGGKLSPAVRIVDTNISDVGLLMGAAGHAADTDTSYRREEAA
jgi:simple sugar transport system ATP-binding protein